jgi:hypothetical protein
VCIVPGASSTVMMIAESRLPTAKIFDVRSMRMVPIVARSSKITVPAAIVRFAPPCTRNWPRTRWLLSAPQNWSVFAMMLGWIASGRGSGMPARCRSWRVAPVESNTVQPLVQSSSGPTAPT